MGSEREKRADNGKFEFESNGIFLNNGLFLTFGAINLSGKALKSVQFAVSKTTIGHI
jgi:hypothetical protein